MISVIFTCKGRPSLTELCLRRFTELMPEPYELLICYDGYDTKDYTKMLADSTIEGTRILYPEVPRAGRSRFSIINRALFLASGDLFMHLENDFYWQDPMALDEALNALHQYREIDYIRFEYLPFTSKVFHRTEQVGDKGIHWMKDDAPYRFTFNPHIRREKFPCGRFQESDFTKQPEQHHNDNYNGVSCCMDGENFRHLGLYDEGGNYKPYYAERFTLRRGERVIDRPLHEFDQFCSDYYYRQLFMRYIHDHQK